VSLALASWIRSPVRAETSSMEAELRATRRQ
jgi:hypothetical protein